MLKKIFIQLRMTLSFVFRLNLDPEHNPYFPKKTEEEADKFLIHA